LSRIQKQLDRQGAARGMSRSEMKDFLDKLEQDVTGELDRRTLLDAERYLRELARRGESRNATPREREEGTPDDDRREKNAGREPGDGPQENAGKPSLPRIFGA
jgi:hypothetical protein